MCIQTLECQNVVKILAINWYPQSLNTIIKPTLIATVLGIIKMCIVSCVNTIHPGDTVVHTPHRIRNTITYIHSVQNGHFGQKPKGMYWTRLITVLYHTSVKHSDLIYILSNCDQVNDEEINKTA